MTDPEPNKKKPRKMGQGAKKLSHPEKAHIEELLKSALTEYAYKHTRVIKDKEEIASKLTSFITEYLGAFILMGYDTKGEPFNIIHATSQLDADAISTAINKFIFNSINNNQ